MVSQWSLSDCKSLQVSRTILSNLADLHNAVFWMVSICHLISKSSSPFTNHLRIIPSAPTIIGITVTFIFHSFLFFCFFFSFLAGSWYLSLFSLSHIFILRSAGTATSTIRQIFFFFVTDNHYYHYHYHLEYTENISTEMFDNKHYRITQSKHVWERHSLSLTCSLSLSLIYIYIYIYIYICIYKKYICMETKTQHLFKE